MPRVFTDSLTAQKNKMNSRAPWLVAVEISVPSGVEYLVNNNEALDWGGQTYSPYWFEFDTIPSRSSGELPEVGVTVFNTAEMAEYIGENDGLVGYGVIVNLVYAAKTAGVWAIAESRTNYPLRHSFIIVDCQVARDKIVFVVGTPNYLRRPFPARLFHKDWCDFSYKGDYCWMQGRTVNSEADVCDHTYSNCSAHYEDQSRPDTGIGFGGFPNIGKGSYAYV